MPVDTENSDRGLCFHIPIGSMFCMSINRKYEFKSNDCTAFCLTIKDTEFMKMNGFLHDLCGKPFNWVDYLIPASFSHDEIVKDIDVQHPSDIKCVYPAQFVVLLLKMCLNKDRELYSRLINVNSRRITIYDLFYLLQRYSVQRDIDVIQSMWVST